VKSEQLQIRVSPAQKRLLQERARQAGQSVSTYVLARCAPPLLLRFEELTASMRQAGRERLALAELHDLLEGLTPLELVEQLTSPPPEQLGPRLRNIVAAMVEHAAARKGVPAPQWTRTVLPLGTPWFASELVSLRAHLLRASPTAFRRRNLFVDATLGDRT